MRRLAMMRFELYLHICKSNNVDSSTEKNVADFSFYASDIDRLSILDAIIKLWHYSFFPDRAYPTPSPLLFETKDAVALDQLPSRRNVYIFGPFSKRQPFMEHAGNHYYVDQK